ncbi:MAG: MBL fold metallo-hydrolase [Rhodopirellula sp.]|nr:MBL fold metallo-hydrolase [Rhodopirellula sp.]
MKLGQINLKSVSGGLCYLDAGTLYGVVPRVLWERKTPPDDRNRIPQQTNCVVATIDGRNVLIDTGYGSKLPEKQQRNLTSEPGDPLVQNLQAAGFEPADIDVVVFSHLHFDHAGGGTRLNEGGDVVPSFPNAEYIAQRREWVMATSGLPELRGAYPQENLLPLHASGQLRLIDGNVEIMPGLRAVVTGGHTEGHQALLLESDGATAVFLGDICSSRMHLPVLWCLSYDTNLMQTRRIKADLLGEIADNGWLALLDHDPDYAAVRVSRDERADFVASELIESL